MLEFGIYGVIIATIAFLVINNIPDVKNEI
jgi:hypothetical protein